MKVAAQVELDRLQYTNWSKNIDMDSEDPVSVSVYNFYISVPHPT